MNGPRSPERLLLYATPAHECSYLPGREAVTLFADPEFPKDPQVQGMLTEQGFRRSGQHLYRPRCSGCAACEAVRVPVLDGHLLCIALRLGREASPVEVSECLQRFRGAIDGLDLPWRERRELLAAFYDAEFQKFSIPEGGKLVDPGEKPDGAGADDPGINRQRCQWRLPSGYRVCDYDDLLLPTCA